MGQVVNIVISRYTGLVDIFFILCFKYSFAEILPFLNNLENGKEQ